MYQSPHSAHYYEIKETYHSSNPDICSRRIVVMENSSNPDIHPRIIVVHGTSTICQPGPFSTGIMSIHQQYVNLDHPP
jgi:hypothetical protein